MRYFLLTTHFKPVLNIAIIFPPETAHSLKKTAIFASCFPSTTIKIATKLQFLYTHVCFTAGQVSESLQVRIVAGRPIHCQVPGIDHHLVKWAAVRATLEAAKAIALSHLGTLYIAETDERRINRIQQVRAPNL